MKKKFIVLSAISVTLVILSLSIKFINSYSINQEEIVSFYNGNKVLFEEIKLDLDSLKHTNLQAYYSKGSVKFRSNNKDIEVIHPRLIVNLKIYFKLTNSKNLRGARINYYNNAEWFWGNDRIEFSFYYSNTTKSAVDTGIVYLEEVDEEIHYQDITRLHSNWFYYFTGLV